MLSRGSGPRKFGPRRRQYPQVKIQNILNNNLRLNLGNLCFKTTFLYLQPDKQVAGGAATTPANNIRHLSPPASATHHHFETVEGGSKRLEPLSERLRNVTDRDDHLGRASGCPAQTPHVGGQAVGGSPSSEPVENPVLASRIGSAPEGILDIGHPSGGLNHPTAGSIPRRGLPHSLASQTARPACATDPL